MSSRKRHVRSNFVADSSPNYSFGHNSSMYQNFNEGSAIQDYSNASVAANRSRSPNFRAQVRQDARRRSRDRSPLRRHRIDSLERETRGRRSRSRSRGFQNRNRERMRFEPPENEQQSRKKRSQSIDRKRHRGEKGNYKEAHKDDTRFSPPPDMDELRLNYGAHSKSTFYNSDSVEIHNQQETRMNTREDRLLGSLEENLAKNHSFSGIEVYPQTETQKFSQNFGHLGDVGVANNSFVVNAFPTNEIQGNTEKEAPLIPDFNPETSKITSQQWIDLIEETSKKQGWKKDEKQYVMTSRLGGFASQWYISTGVNNKSWESLKKAFLTSFPSQLDYHELLKNMMERVKDKKENITQYFNHKIALLNACEIFGSKAVSCIIGGLPNIPIRQEAISQNFQDPDSLYSYLRSNYKEEREIEENPKHHDKKCLACGVKGHIKVNCPSASKSRGSTNVVEEYASSSYEFPSPECFTEIYINDVVINGYLDRTSITTTIKEESAIELKLSYTRAYKAVRGSRGSMVSSIGYVDLPIGVDRAYAKVTLYVVPNKIQPIPVIVGKSFLDQRHIYILNGEDKMRVYQRMDNGGINFDF